MHKLVPTDGVNINARLFWRYALLYICAVVVGILMATQSTKALPFLDCVASVSVMLVVLAALAALSTVSNAYLCLISIGKGLYDAYFMHRITCFAKVGLASFWVWNACFFLVAAAGLLFLLTASSAARFSYEDHGRDFTLLFSRPFGRYFLETILLLLFTAIIYFLWPRLLLHLPTV
ncbi:MAG: hypothetical protein IKC75_06100 [Clostridia bacterium]|nr:hypothetical protein [Clostridia bacterium]